MRTFFAIIFGFVIIFTISVIINLIPISSIGDKIALHAKEHNITFIPNGSSNFRLLGLKTITNKFKYEIKLQNSKLTGKGENYIYSLLSKDIYIENLTIEIHLSKNDTLKNILENVKKALNNHYYSLNIKNLIINLYIIDNEKEILNDELLLSNIEITKKENKIKYNANIGINKDKKTAILITIDKANTDNYEINAKISDDDFSCYVYDSQKGGKISCLAQNLLISLKDLGFKKIEDAFFNKILNKRISLKADIQHSGDKTFSINGNLNINDNLGKISFNSDDKVLNLEFDKIDLNKTADDVKELFQNEDEAKQEQEAMMMAGKDNTLISKATTKDMLENINSLNKVVLYAISLTKNIEIEAKFNANTITLENNRIENLFFNVSKTQDGKFDIKEISGKFGENLSNIINIKYTNDKVGNILIYGKNIQDLFTIFNIQIFNQNLITNNYFINGEIKASLSDIQIKDLSIYTDGNQVCNYNLEQSYSYENKNTKTNKNMSITQINLNKYYNFKYFIKTLYEEFSEYQQQEKQDAIFWKKLFNKRHQQGISDEYIVNYTFSNVGLYNNHIENFALQYKDNKIFTNIDIASNGDLFDGTFNFNIKNIKGKETINSSIKANHINLYNIDDFFNDIKLATNKNCTEIFYEDKDYNIPSLIGINGDIVVGINNCVFKNNNFSNIHGTISIQDGEITTNNFSFDIASGNVKTNAEILLQGRPEMSFAFAISGIDMQQLLQTPSNGYISAQIIGKSLGFNPVKLINNFSGNGKIIIQNLKIPHFDLLNFSQNIIQNGINKEVNYGEIINNKALYFQQAEGNLLIENGAIRGDLTMARELVSGSIEYEYLYSSNILRKLSGSFATMMTKEKLSTPFPIYLPVACNGQIEHPECLVDWKQLEEAFESVK